MRRPSPPPSVAVTASRSPPAGWGSTACSEALGIGPGDEVLLQAPTHIVVPNAIRYTGARPVYVDCLPDNWNIDLRGCRARITPRTKVVVQHTFGIPADNGRGAAFAAEHGLVLIEDCVHALGATWRGRPVGTFGRAAFFSTEETKIISTTMGGMVVTDDDRARRRRSAFQASCARAAPVADRRYLLKLMAYHLLTDPASTASLGRTIGSVNPAAAHADHA